MIIMKSHFNKSVALKRTNGKSAAMMSMMDFFFSLWVSCGSRILASVWRPAGLICSRRCLDWLRTHTPNTNTHMHKHMKTLCHVVKRHTLPLLLSFILLSSVFRLLCLSLSPPSTSSCVSQLRNISRSRQAINIVCPPKIVRIIIWLEIAAVFL